MNLAKSWDQLTEAEKATVAAHNRRHHVGAGRALLQAKIDARAQAFDEAILWLDLNGFAEASVALERVCFEVAS